MAPPAIRQPQSPTLIAGIKSVFSDNAFAILRHAMSAANDPIAAVIAARTVQPTAKAATTTAKAVTAAAATIRLREITDVLCTVRSRDSASRTKVSKQYTQIAAGGGAKKTSGWRYLRSAQG
jgi:predicted RNA-binding Zn ribbon-like protein